MPRGVVGIFAARALRRRWSSAAALARVIRPCLVRHGADASRRSGRGLRVLTGERGAALVPEEEEPRRSGAHIEEIQLASLINQLQDTNPMSNTEALQWAAEADDSLARNEILRDVEIIRTVTAEDDGDDDDVTPVKISHSEAVAALNTSLEWVEEQNLKSHEIVLLRRLRDRAFELKIGTAAQKKKKKSLTFLDNVYIHSLTYVCTYHVHSIYPYNVSS
ncbi:hypothetical protein AVEN_49305-1 [Araneus ventricosus]|uniref:Uncharacterized protein n=1 Tax=Araneus ventricosus TaxID=182803 RepID=A0A4Y2V0T5_ARAVE|nr:hypothetical protein AVEN_49305-1 [Araneus ventricosus]